MDNAGNKVPAKFLLVTGANSFATATRISSRMLVLLCRLRSDRKRHMRIKLQEGSGKINAFRYRKFVSHCSIALSLEWTLRSNV